MPSDFVKSDDFHKAVWHPFLRIVFWVPYPTKSACMLMTRRKCETPYITLRGSSLECIDSIKHLGNYTDSHLNEHTEVRMKKNDLVKEWTIWCVCLGKQMINLWQRCSIVNVHIFMSPKPGTQSWILSLWWSSSKHGTIVPEGYYTSKYLALRIHFSCMN